MHSGGRGLDLGRVLPFPYDSSPRPLKEEQPGSCQECFGSRTGTLPEYFFGEGCEGGGPRIPRQSGLS